jgi:hypothetical protein
MRHGDERLIRIFQQGRLAFHLAHAMEQPVALNLENRGYLIETLEVGVLGPSPHDVIDEGTVDMGELGHLAGMEAQLPKSRLETVGHCSRRGHGGFYWNARASFERLREVGTRTLGRNRQLGGWNNPAEFCHTVKCLRPPDRLLRAPSK